MAIFHSHVKIISRGKGKSAVAAAAYRAGENIRNDYDGRVHDYTRKSGIVHTEIILPSHAPIEYSNRAVLWNAVEAVEKAKNSQLAREFDIALPVELSREENISLIQDYVKSTFVDSGMCADLCVHDTGNGNPHAHIMLTMRPINDDGTWGAKQRKKYLLDDKGSKIYDPKKRQYRCSKFETTDWNNPSKADEWRKAWEDMCNTELKRLGHNARIDRRTYAEQGVEKVPAVHIGVSSAQMEIKGFRTERVKINREIAVSNKELRQINARLKKLKSWLYSQPFDKIERVPSMSDVLQNIKITEKFRSNARKVADLQAFANVVNFLRVNNLNSIDELADKVTNMHQSQYDLAGEIKKQDRRLATLDLHLHNVEIYNSHKSIYQEYLALPENKREAFKVKNSASITAHDTAHKYLTGVLNGRTSIPAKAWKAEREKLMSERLGLCDKYFSLKDDVRSMEKLHRGVERIMDEVIPPIGLTVEKDKTNKEETVR